MSDGKKTITLTIFLLRFIIVLIIPVSISLLWLIPLYLQMRSISGMSSLNIIIPAYISMPFIALLLFCGERMLSRIKTGEIFTDSNINSIKTISKCCYLLCAIFLVSFFFYKPFVFFSVALFFCGLILTVISNVFSAAVRIKKENDYTI